MPRKFNPDVKEKYGMAYAPYIERVEKHRVLEFYSNISGKGFVYWDEDPTLKHKYHVFFYDKRVKPISGNELLYILMKLKTQHEVLFKEQK